MIKKMDILLVVFLFAVAGIMYHFASENAAGDVLYIYKNNKLGAFEPRSGCAEESIKACDDGDGQEGLEPARHRRVEVEAEEDSNDEADDRGHLNLLYRFRVAWPRVLYAGQGRADQVWNLRPLTG